MQGDEDEMEGLTSNFDDELGDMNSSDPLTMKLQELRRRYGNISFSNLVALIAGWK